MHWPQSSVASKFLQRPPLRRTYKLVSRFNALPHRWPWRLFSLIWTEVKLRVVQVDSCCFRLSASEIKMSKDAPLSKVIFSSKHKIHQIQRTTSVQIQVYSYLFNLTLVKNLKCEPTYKCKNNRNQISEIQPRWKWRPRPFQVLHILRFSFFSNSFTESVIMQVHISVCAKNINFVSDKQPRRLFSRPSTSKHLKQFVLAGKLEVDIFLALRCSQTLVWVWVCVGVGDLIECLLIPADIEWFWKWQVNKVTLTYHYNSSKKQLRQSESDDLEGHQSEDGCFLKIKMTFCGFEFCVIFLNQAVCRDSARFMRPFKSENKNTLAWWTLQFIQINLQRTQFLMVRSREKIWIFQDCKTGSLNSTQVQSQEYKAERQSPTNRPYLRYIFLQGYVESQSTYCLPLKMC